MWKDDERLLELFNHVDEKGTFPCMCPSCNKKGGHVFLYRFDEEDSVGSGWAWCSLCKGYSHVTYKIPGWWENMESIDEDRLETEPDYLDSISTEIDKHLTGMLNRNNR